VIQVSKALQGKRRPLELVQQFVISQFVIGRPTLHHPRLHQPMLGHVPIRQFLIGHLVLYTPAEFSIQEWRALAPGLDNDSCFDSFNRWLALESRSRP
jgi:hypothetical protein